MTSLLVVLSCFVLAVGYAVFMLGTLSPPPFLFSLIGVDAASAIEDHGNLLGYLIIIAGIVALQNARRLRAVRKPPAIDPRQPVLYLRSFVDDSKTKAFRRDTFFRLLAFTSEEEDFARLLTRFGPPIAVGSRGDRLPEVGFQREYFADSEWKERVRELMARAKLVILRAGTTNGLKWELGAATQTVAPESLVVLVPEGLKRNVLDETFREYGLVLPDAVRTIAPRGVSVAGAIYFSPSWEAYFQRAWVPFWSLSAFNPALYAMHETLRPVRSKATVPWSGVPLPIGRMFGAFMLFGVPVILFVLLYIFVLSVPSAA